MKSGSGGGGRTSMRGGGGAISTTAGGGVLGAPQKPGLHAYLSPEMSSHLPGVHTCPGGGLRHAPATQTYLCSGTLHHQYPGAHTSAGSGFGGCSSSTGAGGAPSPA